MFDKYKVFLQEKREAEIEKIKMQQLERIKNALANPGLNERDRERLELKAKLIAGEISKADYVEFIRKRNEESRKRMNELREQKNKQLRIEACKHSIQILRDRYNKLVEYNEEKDSIYLYTSQGKKTIIENVSKIKPPITSQFLLSMIEKNEIKES